MSAPRRGRGRGKIISGQDSAHSASPAPSAIATPTPEPQAAPTPAPAASTSAPGPARRKLGTATPQHDVDLGLAGGSAGADGGRRSVGGLLGAKSEYAKKVAGPVGGSKLKFVPNMRRKQRVVDDDEDDEDVKMEEEEHSYSAGKGRGRGRGRGRVEIEMTASGPMAQGPGGAPRAWGPKMFAPGGAGVMNAARAGAAGGGSGQFADAGALDDPDVSDLEQDTDDEATASEATGYKVWAKELDEIGAEDEMAPLTLPKDPKVLRNALERRKRRKEQRVADQALSFAIKRDPDADDDSVRVNSNQGTPFGADSRGASTAPTITDTTVETEAPKPDDELVGADFNLPRGSKEQLYMFQFPRQFPNLVDLASLSAEAGIKAEDDVKPGMAAPKSRQPPDWGRWGLRANKAARWPTEQGQMGELCVHKSGKVSLRINGDLHYDILPAAMPSFLQELAIIDHDPATAPVPASEAANERPESNPSGSIVMMGQTSKKFIVVPDAVHLLDRIGEQERDEREAELIKKQLKKEAKKERL